MRRSYTSVFGSWLATDTIDGRLFPSTPRAVAACAIDSSIRDTRVCCSRVFINVGVKKLVAVSCILVSENEKHSGYVQEQSANDLRGAVKRIVPAVLILPRSEGASGNRALAVLSHDSTRQQKNSHVRRHITHLEVVALQTKRTQMLVSVQHHVKKTFKTQHMTFDHCIY